MSTEYQGRVTQSSGKPPSGCAKQVHTVAGILSWAEWEARTDFIFSQYTASLLLGDDELEAPIEDEAEAERLDAEFFSQFPDLYPDDAKRLGVAA